MRDNKELMKELKMGRAEFIAKIRHIAWISYQIAAGQPYNVEINEDQMNSLLDGIKYLDQDLEATAETNHVNWMMMKREQGWKCGRVKDFEAKTHPDLVPYDQLPEIEKRKDKSDMIVHTEADRLWREIEGPVPLVNRREE
jgi:hypothetical protein